MWLASAILDRAMMIVLISYHILSPKSTQFCPNLSTFVQVCPTCAQKHCTRKQISIASGSYPFCAAFFFMLLLAIQLDTDFMIFKAAQLRKSVIRLIFKFNRPFTSTLYPIKRTMSTEFGIMSFQSSTIPFSLINVCKQIIRTAFC